MSATSMSRHAAPSGLGGGLTGSPGCSVLAEGDTLADGATGSVAAAVEPGCAAHPASSATPRTSARSAAALATRWRRRIRSDNPITLLTGPGQPAGPRVTAPDDGSTQRYMCEPYEAPALSVTVPSIRTSQFAPQAVSLVMP